MIAALVALGLLAGAVVWDILDDETDVPDTPDEPDEPDAPDEEDLGATVTENEDGTVSVELGDDETGSLIALRTSSDYYVGSGSGHGTANDYTLTLYLMPEGFDFPENTDDLPDDAFFVGDLEEMFGLQELASWDLGEEGHNPEPWADGTGPVTLWDSRIEAPDIVSDAPISFFEVIEDDGELRSVAMTDDPDFLNDDTVRVHHFNETDGDGETEVAAGGTFAGTDGDDIILVNPNQTGEITIDAGDGDDTITVGAHQNVTSALATGNGTAEDDGADVISVHLPAYEAPEGISEAFGEAGAIDFRDEDDSLTVVLPDPSEASAYLVHEREDVGQSESLYRADTYFLILGPPGATISDAELRDWYDSPEDNTHLGLRVVSEIDLGAASGSLGEDGSPDWDYDHRNMNPDITFDGTLTGQVTISY
ncbi:hypothetical protein [Shimia haliotis]|uniref:Uncharacterized protein n=1 Tax=Shimia haliotis TaxID=1280847 RepID=A0A1I4CXX2_9RHOB|nr:hypothetical protein [Shimia haliotis]SFK85745.1 hypothetical protein SAMN04488036_102567 [Shimia haliotis]